MTAPTTSADDPFTNFVRTNHRLFHYNAVRICRDETLAQDLVQETYIKILRARDSATKLNYGFAMRVLTNVAIDHFRKEARDRRMAGQVEVLEVERLASDPGKTVSDRSHVLWFLEVLPPRQREVYFLKEVGGFTAAEIGELLGMAEGTVRNWFTTIRDSLNERRQGPGDQE